MHKSLQTAIVSEEINISEFLSYVLCCERIQNPWCPMGNGN